MLERLARRLKVNPSDDPGWALLTNACKVLDKLDEVVQAFARLARCRQPTPM